MAQQTTYTTLEINNRTFSFSSEALAELNTILRRADVINLKEQYNKETEVYESVPSGRKIQLKSITRTEWLTVDKAEETL